MTATTTSESQTAAELQGAVPIGSGVLLDIWYHGCYNGAGHHLRSKQIQRPEYHNQPWGYKLDSGLLTDNYYGCDSTPTDKYVTASKDGWTAVSFWDRSGGDERPGCNSTFLVHAEMSGEELLRLAKQQWPEIFSRRGFPLMSNAGAIPRRR